MRRRWELEAALIEEDQAAERDQRRRVIRWLVVVCLLLTQLSVAVWLSLLFLRM